MPRFCANLSMLFCEHDFLDRFAAAAAAGFTGVECQFPYAFAAHDIAERLQRYGLQQVLFNLPAGDWTSGERGIACHPGRVEEFREGVDLAIEYAMALDCRRCNVLAGIRPEEISPVAAKQTLIANLGYAADRLQAHGIALLVEAINTHDVPGFFLHGSSQTLALVDQVGRDNLFLQYDIYHMQRMEGEIAATIAANLPRIAHMQFADNPGRHEPGSGEINFGFLFRFIDSIGYGGWLSAEYTPAVSTAQSLGWMREARA